MSPFRRLTPETRHGLMLALDAGRLLPPYTALALRRYVGAQLAAPIAAELDRLAGLGMAPAHAREAVKALAGDERGPEATLVWSGPEEGGTASRDTSVVVRELFAEARRSVLVAGFAVYQGHSVFKVLAERMDAAPALTVTMFLNVERPRHDTSSAKRRSAKRFAGAAEEAIPGKRVPAATTICSAVEPTARGQKRSSLHAKCVLVDDAKALVTSANFTEAAQERNIEAGVLVESPSFTAALRSQFDGLVAAGRLTRVPGL